MAPDLVVVAGEYAFAATQDGQPASVPQNVFTWVLKKEGESWVVRHWHTSTPEEMITARVPALRRTKKRQYAITATST